MYNDIMDGLSRFASSLTLDILAIIAVILVATILVAHIVFAVLFKKSICNKLDDCRNPNVIARRFRVGVLTLAWIFFALNLIHVAFLPFALYLTLIPVVVLVLVYIMNFVFLFFHHCKNTLECTCDCIPRDCPKCHIDNEVAEEEKEVKKQEKVRASEKKPKRVVPIKSTPTKAPPVKVAEPIIEPPAPVAPIIQPTAIYDKPKPAATPKPRAVVAPKLVAPKPSTPKKAPSPRKPRISPTPKPKPSVAESPKPMFSERTVTPTYTPPKPSANTTIVELAPGHTVETSTTTTVEKSGNLTSTMSATAREVNLYSDGTMTGKAVSSNAKSTTELRAEREQIKAEYDKLETQLKQMRDDNLKKLNQTPATVINATGRPTQVQLSQSTPHKSSNTKPFTPSSQSSAPKSIAQKFDEAEVAAALGGLKKAMDEMQNTIDSKGE